MSELVEKTLRFLRRRKTAYQLAMGSPAGQEVLIDLAKFCRASAPAWSDDARHHARLEGRREVWLRIQDHLRLSEEQLFSLFNGHQFNTQKEDDR